MNHHFWVFAMASLLLNITPGNDMIFVASRSAGQGTRAGIMSALGIMAGCMVHVLAAVAGLSAIMARSALAFSIVKYIGAGYLIYLGVRALTNRKPASFGADTRSERQPYGKVFWQGVWTNVLNPKVALFFLAFLPQFVDIGHGNPQWRILFLGAWFDLGGTLVNILVAILIGRMSHWLRNNPRWFVIQEKITGGVLLALGIKVALTSKN
ncbi:MAG: LysE family translocator [Bacteroidota bacterium]|nr:LysE family translocator [Bacteroidota bacterium]MDP4217349.1 LysE family translocator [Bacteroidota bacterium]MDP4245768.1 LysE family translocator [Bacteroidota bacterium]MDP4253575.1 LysE family translocator [Bacteroidota bacterium]MDP4257088.1 LysE family translocator [Bacteroidota bacterium]